MLIFVLVVSMAGHGMYKYTQTHTTSVQLSNQQILGVRSGQSANENQLYKIQSTQSTFTNLQSAETTVSPSGVNAKIDLNIDTTSLNNKPRRGIFQPRNPGATIQTVR